jgi:hypothetical protein
MPSSASSLAFLYFVFCPSSLIILITSIRSPYNHFFLNFSSFALNYFLVFPSFTYFILYPHRLLHSFSSLFPNPSHILVRIRMRILGSVSPTNGSRCGSGRTKNIWIRNTGTFTSFVKEKKVIKKSQNSRNQGFSIVLLDDGSRIRPCEL